MKVNVSSSNRSFGESIRQTWREIKNSKDAVWALIIRDFKVQYKQKLFGYGWSFLLPFLSLISFLFMHYAGILNVGEMKVPYPLFLFCGVTLWSTVFVNIVVNASQNFLTYADLMTRTSLPKVTFILASLGGALFQIFVFYLTLLVLIIMADVHVTMGVLYFVPLIMPLIILSTAFSLSLSLLNVVARDISTIFSSIMSIFMYLTPVVYVSNSKSRLVQTIIEINPLTHLINFPRQVFFLNDWSGITEYLISAALCVAFLLLNNFIFFVLKDKIVERF